jgi:methionyl-tRNA formyltransferase
VTIVFFGTPHFACASLETLLASTHEVKAVVTVPDKAQGRGKRVLGSPVKEAAAAAGLPVLQPEQLRDAEFLSALEAIDADLFIVVAFRILPPEVFAMPRAGSFNLHASLLPRYRGAAPINRALMAGETRTGVTTFLLREKVDTGGILLQRAVDVGPETTAGELAEQLASIGARLVLETVDGLAAGALRPLPQDDALATPAPKIHREQCRIDWTRPASVVHNFVRGLSPAPAAWTLHGGTLLKLLRSVPDASLPSAPAGAVVADGASLRMACGEGWLRVLELQQEGRKAMTAEAFLRGYRLGDDPRLA